jgi:hypothetical protein
MINVKTNALNAKGNLRPNVRSAIKDEIAEVVVVFKNGKTASLSYQGHGDYYGNIAQCEDITIRGNAHLAITINDYVYNAPTRKPKANDNEPIEIE